MSFSPEKVQAELEHEIERRISHESPSKYDLDFYLRKITRLENDLNDVQDELAKARVRLRRAEDFQIKYDLLMKQNSGLLSDLDIRSKETFQLKSKYETLKVQLDDRHSKGEDYSNQIRALHAQVDKWKTRSEQLEERSKIEAQSIRQRVDIKVREEITQIKRDFVEKEEANQQEIRKMKKALYEKEAVQNVVSTKIDKVRKDKDEEIRRLSKLLESKKYEHSQALKEKNDQLDRLREKFEKMFNFELQNLRKSLDDQDQVFNIQVNGLRQILALKNDEITNLLKQLKEESNQHEKDREMLLADINKLKEKIYTIQRQNQLELYNIKERLSKIHALQIENQEKRYTDLVTALKSERTKLEDIMKEKDKIIDAQRRDMERVKEELLDRLRERQSRITDLQERLKEFGDINASEMKNLHESFHKIETEKENISTDYQANVGFLNQQIAKLQATSDLKNTETTQLREELSMIKRHHADAIRELEENWREERREREEQRERQRQRREKLMEEQRAKEREWRNKERELQREKQKEEREKNKLKYISQELQRDIQRLNAYIKNIDEGLKREMKKNQLTIIDGGGVRRQLTSEIEKQKNELEAIKRMEVDQIRRKCQIEITRLNNLNEKLQTDLLKKEVAYGELEGQLKKLEHLNKNIQRINKEKLVEYQKKMATLNNEINLTQNLYQAFLESTARKQA